MPWKTQDGRYLKTGQSWKDDRGVTHPSNWMVWSDDYKTDTKNLTWEEPLGPFNSYYYSGWNSNGDALVEKPLAPLQVLKLDEAKGISKSTLAETDWYVVRKTEENTAIPAEVTAYRTAVRTNYTSLKTAINNASNIDELIACYESVDGLSDKPLEINATSSSVVSTSTNKITSNGHGFVNDEQVYYNVGVNSGGDEAAVIGGLVNNTIYFVHSALLNSFKLSESHSNCGDDAVISLTALSSNGNKQTLTSKGKPGKGQTWPDDRMLKYDGS